MNLFKLTWVVNGAAEILTQVNVIFKLMLFHSLPLLAQRSEAPCLCKYDQIFPKPYSNK